MQSLTCILPARIVETPKINVQTLRLLRQLLRPHLMLRPLHSSQTIPSTLGGDKPSSIVWFKTSPSKVETTLMVRPF